MAFKKVTNQAMINFRLDSRGEIIKENNFGKQAWYDEESDTLYASARYLGLCELNSKGYRVLQIIPTQDVSSECWLVEDINYSEFSEQ